MRLQDGTPIDYLEEIEALPQKNGKYALVARHKHGDNVYMVDLDTGLVTRTWDLTELYNAARNYAKTNRRVRPSHMTGIAFDKTSNTFFITGN